MVEENRQLCEGTVDDAEANIHLLEVHFFRSGVPCSTATSHKPALRQTERSVH